MRVGSQFVCSVFSYVANCCRSMLLFEWRRNWMRYKQRRVILLSGREELALLLDFDVFVIYLFTLIVAIPYDFLFWSWRLARLTIESIYCRHRLARIAQNFASCTDYEICGMPFFSVSFLFATRYTTIWVGACWCESIPSIFLSFHINIKRLLLFSAWINPIDIANPCHFRCVCGYYFVFVMRTFGSFEIVIWHIMYGINTQHSVCPAHSDAHR